MGVGEGKTLASFLMPRVLKAERPLLLIPPSMRSQAQADWISHGEHFNLPSHMEMRSYEEISTQPGLLKSIMPDLIVADEVHKLKNPTSTRTSQIDQATFSYGVHEKQKEDSHVCGVEWFNYINVNQRLFGI